MRDRKVLIAEDSSVIQNLTKRILQMQDYKIFSARNGVEVMGLLDKEGFDIILMDINMPKMNGLECAEKIRSSSNENIKNIPIVAITGNAMNLTQEDFEKAGINEYLTKPLDFDELVSVVNKWVEKA